MIWDSVIAKTEGDSMYIRPSWDKHLSWQRDPRVFYMLKTQWYPSSFMKLDMCNGFETDTDNRLEILALFAKLNLLSVALTQKLASALSLPYPSPEELLDVESLLFLPHMRERSSADSLLVKCLDKQLSKALVGLEILQERHGMHGSDRTAFDWMVSFELCSYFLSLVNSGKTNPSNLYSYLFEKFQIFDCSPVDATLVKEFLLP